ncbi:MAG TPA: Hsp20/alpha crystallin family protein [Firmicutes bacterium]|nr:Hsp20/alpha crystallin family protein [Bacillota bacterium]
MDLMRWNPMYQLAKVFEPIRWPDLDWVRGPSVDVYQSGNDLVVEAEVPGMNAEDLDVRVSEGSVTISGRTQHARETERQGFYYSERRSGSFYRSIPLPTEIQPDKAKASYKNGVLEIRAPVVDSGAGKSVKLNIEQVQ